MKIFNEKEADELILLDIDASTKNTQPNYKMIKRIARECRMPLCYGGGIKTVEQARKIVSLGVEKIALSSMTINNIQIVKLISDVIGTQSVVVTLDYMLVKKFLKHQYILFTHNGNINTGIDVFQYIKKLFDIGVGEILLNSIDNDGTMKGYDLKFAEMVREKCDVPLTILGGAGNYSHILELINKFNIIGGRNRKFICF